MQFTVNERKIKCEDIVSLIGDNGDYEVTFSFDEEWEGQTKTARFLMKNRYVDVILKDDACTIPVEILKQGILAVGVYAEKITSTICEIPVKPSIKEKAGNVAAPTDDVYAQLLKQMQVLEQGAVSEERISLALSDFMEKDDTLMKKSEFNEQANAYLDKNPKASQEDVDSISNEVFYEKKGSINLFDKTQITLDVYPVNNGIGTTKSVFNKSGAYTGNQEIPIKQGDVIYTSATWIGIFIYNENNQLVQTINNKNNENTVTAEDAKYLIVASSKTEAYFLDRLMIAINEALPISYEEYSASKKISMIEKINTELESINPSKFKKAYLLLNFDAFNFNDNRFAIVNDEYNFKATVTFGTANTVAYNKTVHGNYNKLLKHGWGYMLYSTQEWTYDVYGDDALADEPTEEIQEHWNNYVKKAIEYAESNGIYNVISWACRMNKACVGLNNALKKYGIRMCRGNSGSQKFTDTFSFVNNTNGLYPTTVDACISALDNAVATKTGISVFSHGLYETEEKATTNYGCTENNLRTFLDAVKTYVDKGELEVITYHDMYAKYFPVDSANLDHDRLMRTVVFNSETHE